MKLFRPVLLALAAAGVVSGSPMVTDNCTLSGTYVAGTNVSACSTVVIDSLAVPAGVTLDLSKL